MNSFSPVSLAGDPHECMPVLYSSSKLMLCVCCAGYTAGHVDEFIDELLTTEYSCDIALPRVPKRYTVVNSLVLSVAQRFGCFEVRSDFNIKYEKLTDLSVVSLV